MLLYICMTDDFLEHYYEIEYLLWGLKAPFLIKCSDIWENLVYGGANSVFLKSLFHIFI